MTLETLIISHRIFLHAATCACLCRRHSRDPGILSKPYSFSFAWYSINSVIRGTFFRLQHLFITFLVPIHTAVKLVLRMLYTRVVME
jgi:hypothetical protein